MIIDLFSQSYNPQFVFSSSDIPDLFSDRKDLSYSRTPGKSYMQCLRISLSLFLLCCIPFPRSEEHTSELQSRFDLVCRLLLEKKKVSVSYTITEARLV